jgi:hypothetical protein
LRLIKALLGSLAALRIKRKALQKSIHDDIIWLNENRSKVAKGVPALENIVDELTACT